MARKPRTYGYRTVKEARAVLAQAKREGRFEPTKRISQYRGENVRRIARTLEQHPEATPREIRDIARGRSIRADRSTHLPARKGFREEDVVRARSDGQWLKADLLRHLNRYPEGDIAVTVLGVIIYGGGEERPTRTETGKPATRVLLEEGKEVEYDVDEGVLLSNVLPKSQIAARIQRGPGKTIDADELADWLRPLEAGRWFEVEEISFAKAAD